MKRINTITKFLFTGVLAVSFTAIVPAALAERDDARGKKVQGKVKKEKTHRPDSLAEDKRGQARPDARRGGPPQKGEPGVRRGGPPQKGGPGVRRGGPPQKGGPDARHDRGHRKHEHGHRR